jgi:hypothetical protein
MKTKSQAVAHLAEKEGIPKKTAAAVLVEPFALATKEPREAGSLLFQGWARR